ncbi:MAG: hypothetical protein H7067_09455 [Burkholderiales bacterium]|nr:hypothetical protein [Opitutaceae bacterium]
MKTHLLASSLIIILGLSARLLAQAPSPVVMLDNKYERPTDSTGYYPHGPGEGFKVFSGNLSAWAGKGGRISLTYANGYGLDGSGGIYGHIHAPSPEYMTLVFRNIAMPTLRDTESLTAPIRALQFQMAAKLPASRSMDVYLKIALPKGLESEIFEKRGRANRLALGKITGTGEFQIYKLSCAEIPDKKVAETIRYIRDLYLNGMPETTCELTFELVPSEWMQDDQFLMDNVLLTSELN